MTDVEQTEHVDTPVDGTVQSPIPGIRQIGIFSFNNQNKKWQIETLKKLQILQRNQTQWYNFEHIREENPYDLSELKNRPYKDMGFVT